MDEEDWSTLQNTTIGSGLRINTYELGDLSTHDQYGLSS